MMCPGGDDGGGDDGGATMVAIGYTWLAVMCVFISYLQCE